MIWFAGERGSMAFALAIKTRSDFDTAGDKFLPFTLLYASITLLLSNFFLQSFINKFGFDNKPDDTISLPINGKLKNSNSLTNNNKNINLNIQNNQEMDLKDENPNNIKDLQINEQEPRNINYDTEKPFACFDRIKNWAARIHIKYLYPLVLRENNEDNNNANNIVSSDNKNCGSEENEVDSEIIGGYKNSNNMSDYKRGDTNIDEGNINTLTISQIPEKINNIDDIDNYDFE
jgi:hypothetical protein